MSHQVQINYQQIAVQCAGVCEVAEKQLKEIDELLVKAKEHSESLLGNQTASFEAALSQERDVVAKQITELKREAEQQKQSKAPSRQGDILAMARRLQTQVNALASKKLVEFNGFLDMLLSKSISENYERLRGGANGVVIGESVQRLFDGISDEALRQFTYLAYINDPTLSGDALIVAGKTLMGQTFESRLESEKQKIRAELEAARVECGAIERVMKGGKGSPQEQLTAIRTAASDEIVGEKVRQKSLKIIMQAIQARGFVVDKKNIVKNYFDNEIKRPEILGRIGHSNIGRQVEKRRNSACFWTENDREFSVKIARSKLRPVQRAILEKYRIDLEFKDELKFIDYILGGADSSKGGRDILNAINDKLLDELAVFMFENKADLSSFKGAKILVKTAKNGLGFSFEND